jgi:hypothetical protein
MIAPKAQIVRVARSMLRCEAFDTELSDSRVSINHL